MKIHTNSLNGKLEEQSINQWTKLWSNDDTKTAFTPQDINVDLNGYNFVAIEYTPVV